jgi:hypothetical protein
MEMAAEKIEILNMIDILPTGAIILHEYGILLTAAAGPANRKYKFSIENDIRRGRVGPAFDF